MIVKVIPLIRLPSALSILDYAVPENKIDEINIGQLIIIPFRSSQIFGIIFSISQNINSINNHNLKNIIKIVQKIPLVSSSMLFFLDNLSKLYNTPLNVLCKMALLPLQPKKMEKIRLIDFPQEQTRLAIKESPPKKINYILCKNEKEHISAILKNTTGNTLILVPEKQEIIKLKKIFPILEQKNSLTWHSDLSTKKKFDYWLLIRNNEKRIVIGLRSAVFLPFFKLDNIIIDLEQKENHKHWDQNPRFHVLDVAPILARKNNTQVTLVSHTPSCSSYYYIFKNNFSLLSSSNYAKLNYKDKLFAKPEAEKEIKIIDLQREKASGNKGIFSELAEEKIKNAKGDIFLYINRLGFSSFVYCKDCNLVQKCKICHLPLLYSTTSKTLNCRYCRATKPINEKCDKCGSTIIKYANFGTEKVETEIEQLVKNQEYQIIRIDSEIKEKNIYAKKQKIIIGTKMAFKYIDWRATKLFVFLDIDNELNIPEYFATEQVWQTIQEIQFERQKESEFLIQTNKPEHLIFKSLKEPDRLYRTELNYRQKLFYPPYSYLVRYFYGHSNKQMAQNSSLEVFKTLQEVLTKSQKYAIISGPIEMDPLYFRGKFWYNVIVKLKPENWHEDLIWLNQFIPASWKTDPNPINILSP